jgi:cobalt-zinc-cadmium efflux system protein
MSHKHNHTHQHTSSNIGVAFLLNFGFSIIEFIGGVLTNSTAILSDAVHDLGDSLALALSYFTEKLSKKEKTTKYPYGFKRLSVIGAIVNIVILSLGTYYVFSEAYHSILSPEEVNSIGMFWIAILGILVNGAAVFKMRGSKKILDKTVVLHLLEDLLGWVAVLIVSVVIYYTSLYILDPVLSIIIGLIIVKNIWSNIVQVYNIIMQAIPDEALCEELKHHIIEVDGVIDIEEFKLWSLDGEEYVAALTIVSDIDEDSNIIKSKVKLILNEHKIIQSTIEINVLEE